MKKCKFVLTAFLLVFVHVASISQTKIQAVLLDENNKPVTIANALIIDENQEMVKGTVIYDGLLDLDWEYKPEHKLKIQALGWEDKIIALDECKTNCDFGKLNLAASSLELKEIVVTEKIQLFEAKNGIINVNVENTILSEKESVIEVLQNSPGVLVRGENAIEIFGKGTAQIYIDGVEIQGTEILQSINPTEIKKIEIIENPSAKYDAQGKAVIHIYTKNGGLEGVLGQVRIATSKSTFRSENYMANLSFNKGRYSLYLSGDWNPYKLFFDENFSRRITSDSKVSSLSNEIGNTKESWLNNRFRLKSGFQINKEQRISLEYKGRVFEEDVNRISANNIDDINLDPFVLNAHTDGNKRYNYNILNANYQIKKGDRKTLNIAASQTLFNIDLDDQINLQKESESVRQSLSKGSNTYKFFIAKADYEHKFLAGYNLGLGLKFSQSTNDGSNRLENMEDGVYVPITDFSTDYIYQEENYAAYTTLKKDWKKITAEIGLRFEYTDAVGEKTDQGKFLDNTFVNVFPSVLLNYQLSKTFSTSFNYSKRIGKPSFSDLDPTIDFIDNYSMFKGNPELRPEFTDNYELNFAVSGYPVFKVGYNRSTDPIHMVVEKDPSNDLVNVGIIRNLDYVKSLNLGVTIPYRNKWWTTMNSVSYTRMNVKYNENFYNGDVRKQNNWLLMSYQDFNVKNGWNFGTHFYWYSPGLRGVLEYYSGHNLNFWVTKKFQEGKYKLILQFEDVLRSNIEGADINIENINVQSSFYYDKRKVRLTFLYKFGKLKEATAGRAKNGEEFNRIKTK